MHLAAECGHKQIISMMLDKGADTETHDHVSYVTVPCKSTIHNISAASSLCFSAYALCLLAGNLDGSRRV
jgi:hypothetical protein